MGRIFFYFDQDTIDGAQGAKLKWMWIEGEEVIMRINSGIEAFTFDNEDFRLNCKPEPTLYATNSEIEG